MYVHMCAGETLYTLVHVYKYLLSCRYVIIFFTIVLYFYVMVLQFLSFLALMLDVEGVGGITEATPLTTPVVPAAALAVAVTVGLQGVSLTRAAVAVWAGPNTRGKERSVSILKR